ncbi:MAG TPA: zinc-dependent metalloprotease family protein [Bacteroidia bacterium]
MKKFISLLLLSCLTTLVSAQIRERLPCIDKKFSIVVHIVRDNTPAPGITEPQILENVDSLNKAFAPICVSFEVCEFRYIDNSYYNTIKNQNWEEMQVLYNVKNRINLYYVEQIESPAGACGFAGLGCITNLNSEGVVIKKLASCIGSTSKTLKHEMGHYFGLLHTFEGSGTELVDGSNCLTAGDLICDTPSDPFVDGQPTSNYVNGSCRFISMLTDANGDFYDPIVGNIMSYYPDNCACGFTHDQYMKMAKKYLSQTGMW